MFSTPEKVLEQTNIDPGMHVVDLGAGSGAYVFALSRMVGEAGKVYAVDVQKDLLEKLSNEAKERGLSNIEIIWSDLDEDHGSTLRDTSVDRVIIANTLFQVEKKDTFIAEALRILKPNGKLILVDWTDSFGGLGPKPDDVVTHDMAVTLCENSGFSFERNINAGDHHYGLTFRK